MASCKRQTCQEFVCGTAVCVWTAWFDFNCIEAHRAANLHPINKTTVKSLCQCCDNNNTTTPPIQSTALNWGVVVLSLVKCRCNKDIKKYFFSHRVVFKWNMLDNDSVMAKTVNGFKTKLERERERAAFLHFIHRVVRYNIRPRLSLNELTACPATSLRLRRFACHLGLGNSGASSFDVVYSVIFCRDSLFITVFSTMNDLRFRFSKAAETLG